MGLLDGLLGQVLSGALQPGHDDGRGLPGMGRAQGDAGMGGLDSILGGLAGGGAGMPGAGPAMGGQGGGAALIAILLQLLQQHGGLGGLLSKFQQAGYGRQADSWVSSGGNQSIDPDAVSQVLGAGEIDRIAQKLGVPRREAAEQVAGALPEVVDRMTPRGALPDDSEALVNRALDILKRGGG